MYQESIIWCIDAVGFYSFTLLSCMVLWKIYKRIPFAIMYIVGGAAIIPIDMYLKSWFQDPRPSNPIPFQMISWNTQETVFDTPMYTGSVQYGFPSGHAYMAFYAISYLYFVSKRIDALWLVSLTIGCITLYQRFKYRRHTMEQLAAGTILGMMTGWLVWAFTQKVLVGISDFNLCSDCTIVEKLTKMTNSHC